MTSPAPAELHWHCDVLVVGSGIAGMLTALNLKSGLSVLLVTKDSLEEGSTRYAQGGVAFAVTEEDSVDLHVRDTQTAGVQFCIEDAVRAMVREGRSGLQELQDLGTRFDRGDDQTVDMHREGGHSVARVAHHGDSTGAEISRALSEEIRRRKNITIVESGFLTDLLHDGDVCRGAHIIYGEDRVRIDAQRVVLASGGVGQLFSVTTNPAVATGDGIAAAYRAGVRIADMEFIQFHPTALYESENPRFLISEAMRGEGAHILNIAGDRIMLNKHPLAELAPRDVVVRAMALHMIDSGDDHLYLDVRHLDQEELHAKFPMITSELEKRGFDVSSDLIPISFAAHYTIGGVVTDYHGRSSIRNLYACGETACTGVHGANRLASNSLLEGIVYSNRIARQINDRLDSLEMEKPSPALSATVMRDSSPLVELRSRVTETALRYGGVFRSAKRLKLLHGHLLEYENELTAFSRGREYYELKNLIEIAHLLRRAALNREESRGTHQRQEFSQTDDFWQQHRITFEGDDMTIRSDMTEYID